MLPAHLSCPTSTHIVKESDHLWCQLAAHGGCQSCCGRDTGDNRLEAWVQKLTQLPRETDQLGNRKLLLTQRRNIAHTLVGARRQGNEAINHSLYTRLRYLLHQGGQSRFPGRGVSQEPQRNRMGRAPYALTARFFTSLFWSCKRSSTCATSACAVASSTPKLSPALVMSEIKSVRAMNLPASRKEASATRTHSETCSTGCQPT